MLITVFDSFCLLINFIAEVRCKRLLILISVAFSLIDQSLLLALFNFINISKTIYHSRSICCIVFLEFIDLFFVGNFGSSFGLESSSRVILFAWCYVVVWTMSSYIYYNLYSVLFDHH